MAKVVTTAAVRAYADKYDGAGLLVLRDAAMAADAANLPRVEVTGANFKEGGSSGVYVAGDPAYVLEVTMAAIDRQAAETAGTKSNQGMNHAVFSNRPIGW